MPRGINCEDYLRSCLAPLPIKPQLKTPVKELSEDSNDEEHFSDAIEKSSDQENPDLIILMLLIKARIHSNVKFVTLSLQNMKV